MPSATMSALMTGVSAAGSIARGNAQAGEASAEAKQLAINANNTMGAAERQAQVQGQDTQLVLSKAQANAAAGGALASSPMVVNDMAQLKQRGDYAALTDLYNGESEAQDQKFQASMTQYAGQQALAGGLFDASATIAGSPAVKTLFQRYAMQGPPTQLSG